MRIFHGLSIIHEDEKRAAAWSFFDLCKRFKGRTLFYSKDVKINQILPEILESIMQLTFRTIEILVNKETIKNNKLIGFKATEINVEIPDLRPNELRKNPL